MWLRPTLRAVVVDLRVAAFVTGRRRSMARKGSKGSIAAELVPTSKESKDCCTQLEIENWELRHRVVELALEIQALEERVSLMRFTARKMPLVYTSAEPRSGS